MTKLHPIAMLIVSMLIIKVVPAQDSVAGVSKIVSFSTCFLEAVNKKTTRIEEKILASNERALKQLAAAEKRLQKKLSRKDPVLAKQLFPDVWGQYQSLQSKFTNSVHATGVSNEYIPYLDTLNTSLRFLQSNSTIFNSKLVQQSMERIKALENRFQQTHDIQQQLRSRQQYLKDQLRKLNMAKVLKNYDKKMYYYRAQVDEYKSLLKQTDKIERKAIDVLGKTKPFQDFMQKFSVLGSIFPGPLPASPGGGGVIDPRLQTTAQVNTLIQQTVGGANNLTTIQSNMQQSQSQIQQLKNKINEMGGSSDKEMPGFRPNNQRVKSFWNRWELGTNLQSTHSNNWLPSATQIGLSAGYKLNDRSVIGVGMAGSIGWGKSIRHVVASYEGVSARSFVDWKLKGSFWVSAGYEMNYQSTFTRVEELRVLHAWQRSGLVGISKKYKISKKLKGSMSLLWDYLSYQQTPQTQPVVFRFGYAIK
jgi:hypothetical protein